MSRDLPGLRRDADARLRPGAETLELRGVRLVVELETDHPGVAGSPTMGAGDFALSIRVVRRRAVLSDPGLANRPEIAGLTMSASATRKPDGDDESDKGDPDQYGHQHAVILALANCRRRHRDVSL